MSEPLGTQYGGFWARFLALLADSAIVFLVSVAIIAGAALTLDHEGLVPVALAVYVAGALYWPVMHASRRRGTFGKALVGLKVTRFDGRRISILRSLWREIAKLASAAVVMLGFLMAAFTPRKQGLHDLMSATYVVREGPSRIVPALAVAVAGFALPIFVGPMVLGAAVLSNMTSMAQGLVVEPQSIRQAARPAPKAVPQPAPVPVAKAPEQPAPPGPAPTAPTPAPVAVATPAPVAVATPAPEPIPMPKPAASKAKPKMAVAKPKLYPSELKIVTQPSRPAGQPDELKRVTGLRHNDLMSAVLAGDLQSVNELLRLGKWADKPDSQGVTPLMVAVEHGDTGIAAALLDAGANPRPANQLAQKRGDGEMMVLLARYRR
jgi:uncharacterized RDD family membrane protein YckC